MSEVLLIPLEVALKILQCLFLVWMSGYWSDNGWADVAVELLLKMRMEVLRLVARLGWSVLLRFLHKMLLLVSCVSMIDLNQYWRCSLELVLVLR